MLLPFLFFNLPPDRYPSYSNQRTKTNPETKELTLKHLKKKIITKLKRANQLWKLTESKLKSYIKKLNKSPWSFNMHFYFRVYFRLTVLSSGGLWIPGKINHRVAFQLRTDRLCLWCWSEIFSPGALMGRAVTTVIRVSSTTRRTTMM